MLIEGVQDSKFYLTSRAGCHRKRKETSDDTACTRQISTDPSQAATKSTLPTKQKSHREVDQLMRSDIANRA